MELYLVGQWRGRGKRYRWELQGIFSTVERARAALHGPRFFLHPLILDHEYPRERTQIEPIEVGRPGKKISRTSAAFSREEQTYRLASQTRKPRKKAGDK